MRLLLIVICCICLLSVISPANAAVMIGEKLTPTGTVLPAGNTVIGTHALSLIIDGQLYNDWAETVDGTGLSGVVGVTYPSGVNISGCRLYLYGPNAYQRFYSSDYGIQYGGSGGTYPSGTWNNISFNPYSINNTLYISNSGSGIHQQVIEVECYGSNEQLEANFTGTPTAGASPLYVAFEDISAGSPTSYNWSITPTTGVTGYQGSTQNHFAYFTLPGNYTISHGVSDTSSSDIETKTDYIIVYNATTDYATTGFVAMDKPRWVQLAGATINLYDVGNGTWKNTSASVTGYETITTRSNSTINAYASIAGYGDVQLLAQPAWDDGVYKLEMLPVGYANVSTGSVTLYVSIWGSDVSQKLSGAIVNMAYQAGGTQFNDYRITDTAGMAQFVVPNQTTIYLYSEKAGYQKGGTTISSGNGDGGDDAVYADITLQRLYVTTSPTATTLPGGGTPTTAITADPYPCSPEFPENCERKQTEMANDLIAVGPDLMAFFIILTFIGGLKMMGKK